MLNRNCFTTPALKKILANSALLRAIKKKETPFYLIDEAGLDESARIFLDAFKKYLPKSEFYYAVKSNPNNFILEKLLGRGFGLDVSSARELKQAIDLGAKKIIYTGPGKTHDDLALAVKYSDKVIINIDSFGEMERLGVILAKTRKSINAGVRLYTKFHGHWNKFGIPLARLSEFWSLSSNFPGINLQGVQMHMSKNKDYLPYKRMIKELADYLKLESNLDIRKSLKFIDLGGGFMPYRSYVQSNSDRSLNHVKHFDKINLDVIFYPLEKYARGISEAINAYLAPMLKCQFFFEPGRAISHGSTHLIMRVADVKSGNSVVLDGGINMVGWERFCKEYHPVINLSNPSPRRLKYKLFGSLCEPRDIFGEYCFASDMKEGDIIFVANQGDYAYTMAQNFIKPIPNSFVLGSKLSNL